MNRRMPNGTYGGVRGWGRKAPAYSMRPEGRIPAVRQRRGECICPGKEFVGPGVLEIKRNLVYATQRGFPSTSGNSRRGHIQENPARGI
jgi:hypothetical protein